MNLENELFDVFETVVHEDYPNSQRVNCPGHSILRKLAGEPEAAHSASTLAHISQCAPCFDEMKELRRTRVQRVCKPRASC